MSDANPGPTPNAQIFANYANNKKVTKKDGVHILVPVEADITADAYKNEEVIVDGGLHIAGNGDGVAKVLQSVSWFKDYASQHRQGAFIFHLHIKWHRKHCCNQAINPLLKLQGDSLYPLGLSYFFDATREKANLGEIEVILFHPFAQLLLWYSICMIKFSSIRMNALATGISHSII
jgi:hypothetical protein